MTRRWILAFWLAALPGSAQQSTVSGRVVNAVTNSPAPGVEVQVHPQKATTAADGSFSFSDLSSGRHVIEVSGPGILQEIPGFVITLKPGEQLKQILLRAMPAAAIEGKVLDISGKPVPSAIVSVAGEHRPPGTSTDQQGQFRLDGVRPGATRITVLDSALLSVSIGRETIFRAVSQAVDVKPGEAIRGIVLTVRPELPVRIQGRVTPFDNRSRLLAAALPADQSAADSVMLDLLASGVPVAAGGTFELKRVLPGKVLLYLVQPPQLADGYGFGIRGKTAVTVPAGGLQNAILPPVQLDVSVTGSIRNQGATGNGARNVEFAPVGGVALLDRFGTRTKDTGEFQIQLPRGRYRVSASGGFPPSFQRSVLVNGRAVDDRIVDLTSSAAPVSIEIVTSAVAARVRGVVLKNGKPASQSIVSANGPIANLRTRADQNGEFEFASIPPGDYTFVASERLAKAGDGIRITVRETGNQAITLRLPD